MRASAMPRSSPVRSDSSESLRLLESFGCSDCFESGISRKGFFGEAKASNPRLPSPAVTTRFPSMRITRCKMYLPEMQKRMMSPRFGFSIVTEEQGRMQTESLPARKSGNMLFPVTRKHTVRPARSFFRTIEKNSAAGRIFGTGC